MVFRFIVSTRCLELTIICIRVMVAVFLKMEGIWSAPKVYIIECKTRREAESYVERYAPEYEDSFVMTNSKFEQCYGRIKK